MSLFPKKNKWRVLPRSKGKRRPPARFAPFLLFLVKLVTTTTLVVCILLHSRTISYSDPQLGHMKSGRPDEQSSKGPFQAILSLDQVSPGTLSAKIQQHTTVGAREIFTSYKSRDNTSTTDV